MDLTRIGLERTERTGTPSSPFSILIPSWNNLPYLQLCVESIRKHSYLPHQVIVHVNQGSDGTLEWVRSRPDLDYTCSAENIGVCYALNYARPLIKGDYVVFLNDDMYVCPGWDQALLDEIRTIGHPWFFLSSTVLEAVPQYPGIIRADYGSGPGDFREAALLAEYAGYVLGDWTGATWPPNVVHRDVWDLVGGYSIEYSPGLYSDPDFSKKLWETGVRLFKGVGRSRVYHFGGRSTRRIVHNKGYHQFIGKWGFTSSWLTTRVLRRGMPYAGPTPEPSVSVGARAKMLLKRLMSALGR